MNKKSKNISVLAALMIVLLSSCISDESKPSIIYGSMTDQDGNVYKTVTIGTQTWMAEDLRTTHYNDGTEIPNVTDNIAWAAAGTGAYCNPNNTSNNDIIVTNGRLYNWHTVKTNKLAPVGWHVPTSAEWTTLITYLGGENVAGGKLKKTGTKHWLSPNTGASNEYGFTALSGGDRLSNGDFMDNNGGWCFWWSTTEAEVDASTALAFSVFSNERRIYQSNHFKGTGYYVRLVKD